MLSGCDASASWTTVAAVRGFRNKTMRTPQFKHENIDGDKLMGDEGVSSQMMRCTGAGFPMTANSELTNVPCLYTLNVVMIAI